MAEETGITVLRGLPDAAELAAVTTVLLALLRDRSRPADEPRPAAYADWSVRGTGGPTPGGWPARHLRGRQ
ncbi:acyl-CoA carboxylase subunit epsilon [Streptomyces ficellus]|uniref:Acyl-CoA carboxylase subunit epsilon n=1 Tax=Streptomyces ficellus TaxID=1977088 RepID=A0A6I6F999_9ACTN|nr:acyl-CoA carboxylase subunit epsilon [Streptomyces ficellus]QGV77487.1 acyl-CoA carboxylase subunit epsilon [Streptomyces ficellus]